MGIVASGKRRGRLIDPDEVVEAREGVIGVGCRLL